MTIFDKEDSTALQDAIEVAKEERKECAGFYENMTCQICKLDVYNEKGLVEHKKATGHSKYDVYKPDF